MKFQLVLRNLWKKTRGVKTKSHFILKREMSSATLPGPRSGCLTGAPHAAVSDDRIDIDPFDVMFQGVKCLFLLIIGTFSREDQMLLRGSMPVYGVGLTRCGDTKICNYCFEFVLKYGCMTDQAGGPLITEVSDFDKVCPYLLDYIKKNRSNVVGIHVLKKSLPRFVGGYDHLYWNTPIENATTSLTFEKMTLKYINSGDYAILFSKVFNKGFIESAKLFPKALLDEELVRKPHWEKVITFTAAIHELLPAGRDYETLSQKDKLLLQVQALSKGNFDGTIHVEMKQIDNLLDFTASCSKLKDVIKLMNARSNPEFYMQSGLAKKLEVHNVTAKDCFFTLEWTCPLANQSSYFRDHTKEATFGGKTYSRVDLDLRVTVYKNRSMIDEISYSAKDGRYHRNIGLLKFDSNASKLEVDASECILIQNLTEGLTFRVEVNNFNQAGDAVPFVVKKSQFGLVTTIFQATWTSEKNNNFYNCGTYSFDSPAALDLTDVEKRRVNAQKEKFEAIFGPVTFSIRSIDDCLKLVDKKAEVKSMDDLFGRCSLNNDSKDSKFSRLAESVKKSLPSPCTWKEFLEWIGKTKQTFEITPRDFNPAYVTTLTSNALNVDAVLQKYTRGKSPQLASEENTATVGTARTDGSWVLDGDFLRKREVVAYKMVNGFPFFVVEGMKLPSPDDTNWEVLPGFYGSQMTTEYHEFRSLWATQNTLMGRPSGNGMIGVIPLLNGFTVYVDGKPVWVN